MRKFIVLLAALAVAVAVQTPQRAIAQRHDRAAIVRNEQKRAPPAEFVQAYLIRPPGHGDASLKWTFESATFGKIQGRFAAVGGSILSIYSCEASGYHGAEHLGQIDADHYRSAGMLLLKDRVMYSWETLLTRPGQVP